MKTIDIVLICCLAAWAVGAIIYTVRARKKGKTSCCGCSGDCSHCSGCSKSKGE